MAETWSVVADPKDQSASPDTSSAPQETWSVVHPDDPVSTDTGGGATAQNIQGPDAPSFLPTSTDQALSEAGAVALKGIAGATAGLTEVGLAPVAEAWGGKPGENIEAGYRLSKLLQKNIADSIKAFALSPSWTLSQKMLESSKGTKTLNSDFNVPIPPQPQTGIGQILGMGAELYGGAKLFDAIEARPTVKLPNSIQIEAAKTGIQSNLDTNIAMTNEELKIARTRSDFQEKMIDSVKDSTKISDLQNNRAETAYAQAEAIHGDPVESRGGNPGLGLQASKNLNKAYWAEAEPHFNKTIYVEDAIDSAKTNLQSMGIIDGEGNPIKGVEVNRDQSKALKFYEDLKPVDKEGEIQLLPKKMKVGELKSKLDSAFGNDSGSSILKSKLFQSAVDSVKELKDVNAKFVNDYQARNGVFQKFNIFNKIGWVKGDVSLNAGADALENVASENPAKINRDNLKLMDFIKRYTGTDPSDPVQKHTNDILNVKSNAENRQNQTMYSLDSLENRIRNNQAKATVDAQNMTQSLNKLGDYVKGKEAVRARIKNVISGGIKIATGGSLIKTGLSGAKKLF